MVCQTCGKPIAGNNRPGSLTGYLFSAGNCACAQRNGGQEEYWQSADDGIFCPKCGLKVETEKRAGSLTGFLFQSTRCKCPPDENFIEGRMSDKFWKLKKVGSGTVFMPAEDHNRSAAAGNAGISQIGLRPGAIIGGAYEIISLIGRGGMGEVYLARHQTLGKKCALKVIPPEQVTEMGWQRFQLEAKAVARLDHINLVRVTDLGIHEGCLPYYAMDFIEGKNLADLLAESGLPPLTVTLDIFKQVCDGLDCAHRSGILHRDLKPANIMLTSQKAGQRQVKILDFGLAKLTSQDRHKQSLTAVGDVFGSPLYMSPEQCKGEKLDRRTDIYSIGCTLFECLTGQPPFTGNISAAVIFSQLEADPPSLASIVGPNKYPDNLEIVLAKLLRKNPVERYQSTVELRGDLERVARGEDVEPFYVSRAGRTGPVLSAYEAKTNNRTGAPPALIIGGLCLIVVALAGLTIFAITVIPGKTTKTNLPSSEISDYGSLGGHKNYAARELLVPYSRTISRDGKAYKLFDFPDTSTLGILRTQNANQIFEARGQVTIPLPDQIILEPSKYAITSLGRCHRFSRGDLYGVTLNRETQNLDSINVSSSRNDFIQHAVTIPGIKVVKFLGTSLPFNAVDLDFADKAPDVTELIIDDPNLDLDMFADLRILFQMESINIATRGDLTPILKRLPHLPRLRHIIFKRQTLSLKQLELLSQASGLKSIEFSETVPYNTETSFQALKLLRKLPRLERISVDGMPLTEESVSIIKSFPKLRILEFKEPMISFTNRSDLTQKDLRTKLPILQIRQAEPLGAPKSPTINPRDLDLTPTTIGLPVD